MTSKLTKSKIQLKGKIEIWDDMYLDISTELSGLKQSKSGVYEILNKFSGKRYIGMAKNLEARKRHHIFDLKKGTHKSSNMQFDYNEVRSFAEFDDTFEFNVIIYCYPSELTFWEKILIDNLHPEYNTKIKKQIPPKVFDINGNKIELMPDRAGNQELRGYGDPFVNSCDDDCEEEIM
jgi:excinuclease UvrABC nuclease subunit